MTYARLGEIYEDEGKISEATEHYQHALTLNPKDERLKRRLEKLQGEK